MRFCDLHLCVSLRDLQHVERMMAKSCELGYGQIAVSLVPGVKEGVVEHLREISHKIGVDFVTRLDLAPRSPGELLSGLRSFRRRFEVVSVLCASRPVARQAAKDRRVDLLCFSSAEARRRFFGLAEAESASASSVTLEIDMAQILSVEGLARVDLLSSLRREVSIAKSCGVPLVLSSGATDELFLRKPEDYASLGLLFDLGFSLALKTFSEIPLSLVERNRAKQSRGYVLPGVSVKKEAAACGGQVD